MLTKIGDYATNYGGTALFYVDTLPVTSVSLTMVYLKAWLYMILYSHRWTYNCNFKRFIF